MNFADRLAAIRDRMREEKLDLLIGLHDGAHFIEKPNPVMVLGGFKSLGPAAVVMDREGEDLIVTPHWDAERARDACTAARVIGADDVVDGLLACVGGPAGAAVGLVGLRFLPSQIAQRITTALPQARPADAVVFDA